MSDKYKELWTRTFGSTSTAELDTRDFHGRTGNYDVEESETLVMGSVAPTVQMPHRDRIDPIEIIEDWDLHFHCGTAINHIAQHKLRGRPIEDIQEAIWYLERYMELLKKVTS